MPLNRRCRRSAGYGPGVSPSLVWWSLQPRSSRWCMGSRSGRKARPRSRHGPRRRPCRPWRWCSRNPTRGNARSRCRARFQAFYSAPIYPRVTGYVKAWNVDIGAHVTKGQELAEIDTPDLDQQLIQAQANLASAVTAEQLAAVTAGRWSQLAKDQYVSQQDENNKVSDALSKHSAVLAAQASVGQLEAFQHYKHIVAPFDGIVTARRTDIGDLVSAGSAGDSTVSGLGCPQGSYLCAGAASLCRGVASGAESDARYTAVHPIGTSTRHWSRQPTPSRRTRALCRSSCKPTMRTTNSGPVRLPRCRLSFLRRATWCASPQRLLCSTPMAFAWRCSGQGTKLHSRRSSLGATWAMRPRC